MAKNATSRSNIREIIILRALTKIPIPVPGVLQTQFILSAPSAIAIAHIMVINILMSIFILSES